MRRTLILLLLAAPASACTTLRPLWPADASNTIRAGARVVAAWAASLLLAAVAGCGGDAIPASGTEAAVGRQSRSTGPAETVEEPRAAGGDVGASTGAPAAPVLRLALAGTRLQLSWDGASGAAFYRLFANADGASGFTRLEIDLPAGKTVTALDLAVHRLDWDRARYLLEACNSAGCTSSNQVTTFGIAPPAMVLAQGARARFAKPATTSTAATPPLQSHRSAGATPETGRACARCLPQ